MGVIIKDIEVEGDKGKAVLRTLFDTGASHSLVRRDKAEAIATLVPLAHPWQFRLGDGTSILEVREGCMLTFTVKGLRYLFYFLVADNLAHDSSSALTPCKFGKSSPSQKRTTWKLTHQRFNFGWCEGG